MAISLRVTGTWSELVADGVVTIPATPQAGDRMFLYATWKDFAITAQVISPSGWTEIAEFADGAVVTGNGAGSMKVGCWYRDWQSGDTDPTIDFSTATGLLAGAVIMVMQKGADDVWTTPLTNTAAWPVTATTQTISASATAVVPAGAVVMCLFGGRDDSATMTRAATTGIDVASGISWNGDYIESPATHRSSITGNDGFADLGYRLVTTGGTVTLRMTATIAAVETGAILWVTQGAEAVVPPSPPPVIIRQAVMRVANW